ncbi:potassium transporter-domain-containing protein [Podospora appendiculata]|uniref:Potassium transporter-domain-containing protein n=1 Tax=Podospora appendiculata TaxID=314037 RepID=A0AAE0XJ83_9PEZI|nr:potassium transporter-domain-containing protein [Podospora appendiculata]
MASPGNGTPALQPTIKIAEDALHPVRSESSYTTGFRPSVRADTQRIAGGIYNTRSLSRASFDRRSASRLSHDRRTETSHATHDVEEGDDWRAGDGKKKQIFRGRTLLWLAYQSIGVIYGDIGTSPLYVFSSTFSEAPSYDTLVQALSVIIWSLTIVVTLKYVFIILHADNEGEGGTFSCYSLLTRFANITSRDPREEVTIRIERHLSQDMGTSNRHLRAKIENNKFTRGLLKTIGVLAVSMVMSDGVLTPAQSVLGAVQGLNVVKPDISRATIIGTTCGILVLLFGIQPLGTTKLATTFAPIVILWLAFNCSFGIYNLVNYDWTVLKAFSPYFAIQFFVQNGTHGWRMLGGILLAFTGVEALFADLGAFSMRAIQLSWMCYTYPCLLLAYIGQAAFISVNPDAYSNPFFNSVPPGMLYPSLVVAILAAIVASQAIITATFQLISQIMKLSYCPQVKVVHTSRIFHGQLYVPFLNWLLMLGTILVTVIYSDTTRLGNAYGVCVMFVTFFDTCMVTLVALIVWKLSPFMVAIPWLVFASVDGLYLSSALTKVPDGAWFTLTLSGILACLFLLWRYGKESQWRAEASDRFVPTQLVKKDEEGKLRLTDKWGGDPLNAIRGFGIFFDKTGVSTPAVFTHFVSKFVSVPDTAVFFHLHPVETPTVSPDQRYSITHFSAVPGCYRLVIKHGFMDEVISPDLAALAYEQVRKYIIRTACERLGLGKEGHDSDHEELDSTTNDAAATKTSEPTNATTTDEEKTEAATTSATTTSTNIGTPIKMPTGVQKQAAVAGRHLQFRTPLPLELRDDKVSAELARLDRSYASKVMYIVGKEQMKINLNSSVGRKVALSIFLWIRENTRAKIANLQLAMDRLVEVGFVKEI